MHERNVCRENNPSLGQTPQGGAESHPWMQWARVLITSPRLLPHKTLSLLRPLQPGLAYDSRISFLIHELQKLGLRKLALPSYHYWEPSSITGTEIEKEGSPARIWGGQTMECRTGSLEMRTLKCLKRSKKASSKATNRQSISEPESGQKLTPWFSWNG